MKLNPTSGCGCCTGNTVTFQVFGCNNAGYNGLLISVYDVNGGTLLTSGTTASTGGATGVVVLTWSGTPTPFVTVTGQPDRFGAFGQTVIPAFSGVAIQLTPAAGYVCAACLLPLKTTLNATWSDGTMDTGIYVTGPDVTTGWVFAGGPLFFNTYELLVNLWVTGPGIGTNVPRFTSCPVPLDLEYSITSPPFTKGLVITEPP